MKPLAASYGPKYNTLVGARNAHSGCCTFGAGGNKEWAVSLLPDSACQKEEYGEKERKRIT